MFSRLATSFRSTQSRASSTDAFGVSTPSRVRIVEVGPRDGLQNEPVALSVGQKVELVKRLASTGLDNIEVGSFVSPSWVPQMAGSDEVLAQTVQQLPQVNACVLVPNMKGYESARNAGAKEILIFTAAGEGFCQKNINCTIEESLERFQPIMEAAVLDGIKVRGCVSTIFQDPYTGPVDPAKVGEVALRLKKMGVYEVMLGDTTGVGTPGTTVDVLEACLAAGLQPEELAVHFHDTYGMALANIMVALRYGIATIDSAVAGMGGCPYAKGASGNVATEDVVYMLNGMGIETGIDLAKLVATGSWLGKQLGKPPVSNVSRAYIASHPEVDSQVEL